MWQLIRCLFGYHRFRCCGGFIGVAIYRCETCDKIRTIDTWM